MGHHDPNAKADLEGLKALAHPLRVTIIDALSTYGPQTASMLAERLGESSGSTSYHLRQLEKHGYVHEVADRGTGRERWWQRVQAPIYLGDDETMGTETGREVARIVMREFAHHREQYLRDYIEHGATALSETWQNAASINMANVHVTAAQLEQLHHEVNDAIMAFVEKHRGQRVPGSRPVLVQFFAFPVVDGVEIPDEDGAASITASTATTPDTTATTDTAKEDRA